MPDEWKNSQPLGMAEPQDDAFEAPPSPHGGKMLTCQENLLRKAVWEIKLHVTKPEEFCSYSLENLTLFLLICQPFFLSVTHVSNSVKHKAC